MVRVALTRHSIVKHKMKLGWWARWFLRRGHVALSLPFGWRLLAFRVEG